MKDIAVSLEGVSFIRSGKHILQDVDIEVPRGQCCALLGPNGAGKSTLIAMMSGYIWPSEGSVTVLGGLFGRVNIKEVRERIGLIEPSRMPSFGYNMIAGDVVATGLFGSLQLPIYRDLERAELDKSMAVIDGLGIEDLSGRIYRELSSGEQMKVLIARALVSDAELLVLDEPTVGLDIGARAAVIEMLEKMDSSDRRPTLIIVSHHLDELPRNVDKVVMLQNGRVFCQGIAEDVLTSENMTELYGCSIKVLSSDGRYAAMIGSGAH